MRRSTSAATPSIPWSWRAEAIEDGGAAAVALPDGADLHEEAQRIEQRFRAREVRLY